jgi:hypothetical protein
MKRLALLTILIVAISAHGSLIYGQSSSKLVEFCVTCAGEDATYQKDFPVELEAAGPDGKAPQQKITVVLQKNIQYRFTVCSSENSEGKAYLQLYDMSRLYLSTYNPATGQIYKSFDFQCQKTGPYHIFLQMVDGKKGSAVAILSFVKTL